MTSTFASLATGMEKQLVPTLAALGGVIIAFYVAIITQQIRDSPYEAKYRERFGLISLMSTGFLGASIVTVSISSLINGRPTLGELVYPVFLFGVVFALALNIGDFMVYDAKERARKADRRAQETALTLEQYFEYHASEIERKNVLNSGVPRRVREQDPGPLLLGMTRQLLAIAVVCPPCVFLCALVATGFGSAEEVWRDSIKIYLATVALGALQVLFLRFAIKPVNHLPKYRRAAEYFTSFTMALGSLLIIFIPAAGLGGNLRSIYVSGYVIALAIISTHSLCASLARRASTRWAHSRWNPLSVGSSLYATTWWEERESLISFVDKNWLDVKKYSREDGL